MGPGHPGHLTIESEQAGVPTRDANEVTGIKQQMQSSME